MPMTEMSVPSDSLVSAQAIRCVQKQPLQVGLHPQLRDYCVVATSISGSRSNSSAPGSPKQYTAPLGWMGKLNT